MKGGGGTIWQILETSSKNSKNIWNYYILKPVKESFFLYRPERNNCNKIANVKKYAFFGGVYKDFLDSTEPEKCAK